jgi:centromere/kinetochore protein ZW10
MEADMGKARGHEVLLANFASVSSHIRQSSELQKSLGDISSSLSSLERQIDPSDPQVCACHLRCPALTISQSSFLPPTIDLLQRHFAAVEQKSRAQAHLAALRVLASQTELIERLESAVWAGRGADDWVVAELELANRYEKEEGIEIVQGTKAMLAFQVSAAGAECVGNVLTSGSSDWLCYGQWWWSS